MEFKYLIILCCLTFAVFLIFKEFTRDDKSRLWWRIFASTIMVASFALLIIPITYTTKKDEPAHELNLVTEGASADTISTLKAPLYTQDSNLVRKRERVKVTYLADLAYHLKTHPAVKRINIYGYGLALQDLKSLKGYQVSFHPAALPTGVKSVSWQKQLSMSETLTVQGTIHNPTKRDVKLKLYGMGTGLDSLLVRANTSPNFSFSIQPKQTGKAIFSLITFQDNDTLSVDPIPFEVAAKKPFSVLILASFPDFEYKFLKQWLYENGNPLVFRSQISKDKYSTHFLNRKSVNVNRLNQALLKSIDLTVIDEVELAAISASEKTSIYAAVNNGMGLIIRAAKANTYEATSSTANAVTLKSSDQVKFNNLPFPQTLFLKTRANEQALITDIGGRTVVGSRLTGMGKILTTTLASTYQWQLAGNKNDYAKFWSHIFAKALKKEIATQSFEILPKWPTVNQQSTIKINLSDNKPPILSIDSISISPRQNMELPFSWDGYYWPLNSGWSVLSVNKQLANIYIYSQSDWKGAKAFEKLNTTANFAASYPVSELKDTKIEYLATEQVNKWWYFIIFMVATSFLWYEQRFLANK